MKHVIAALAVSILAVPGSAHADGLSADEIAKKSLAHPIFALEGAEVSAHMNLLDPSGSKQERRLVVVSKKADGALVKSMTRFTAPASIAGTAFLSVQNTGRADDQYVYLPKMKSTRRIGGSGDRDGSFMGTDLSYDDLSRKDSRDATYKKLADDSVGKDPCFKIEAVPKVAGHYAKVVIWVRQKDFVPLKTQAFDSSGALVKTLTVRKIGTFGGHSVATETVAEDAKTHHQTELVIDDVKFDVSLADSQFTPAALAH